MPAGFVTSVPPVTYAFECVIPRRHQELYDLGDEDSLHQFHRWIGKTVSDGLISKYGADSLDSLTSAELAEDDLGLWMSCKFDSQPDGSLRLSFERVHQPYPKHPSIGIQWVKHPTLGSEMIMAYGNPSNAESLGHSHIQSEQSHGVGHPYARRRTKMRPAA
jgi:hypothetical protein